MGQTHHLYINCVSIVKQVTTIKKSSMPIGSGMVTESCYQIPFGKNQKYADVMKSDSIYI